MMTSTRVDAMVAKPSIAERLRIAWLREEEWAVTSYLDFLLATLRALGEQHPDTALAQRCEALLGLPATEVSVACAICMPDVLRC